MGTNEYTRTWIQHKPRQSWGTQAGRIYTEQAFLSFLGNQHRMALDHSLERCCRHGLCMHLWDNERQELGAARFMTSLEEQDGIGWDGIGLGWDDMGVWQRKKVMQIMAFLFLYLSCLALLRWIALVLFTLSLRGFPFDFIDIWGR